MKKEGKKIEGKKMVRGSVKFDQDSRKGTYHRYQIVRGEHGMVGTLYFPKGKEVPDVVTFEVLETSS